MPQLSNERPTEDYAILGLVSSPLTLNAALDSIVMKNTFCNISERQGRKNKILLRDFNSSLISKSQFQTLNAFPEKHKMAKRSMRL